MLCKEFLDVASLIPECVPNRTAPYTDHFIPLIDWSGKNGCSINWSETFRNLKNWPLLFHAAEFHVRELDLPATESLFDMQI
jgi:hypothetical protein